MESLTSKLLYPSYDVDFLKNSTIATRIQMINFTHLEKISLSENDLTSIEGLHRMQMPNLKQLWLGKGNTR